VKQKFTEDIFLLQISRSKDKKLKKFKNLQVNGYLWKIRINLQSYKSVIVMQILTMKVYYDKIGTQR